MPSPSCSPAWVPTASSDRRRIRERGGRVYVQDEATSVVWGMPGQTAAAGFADNIYPLSDIAAEVDRHVGASRRSLVVKPTGVR